MPVSASLNLTCTSSATMEVSAHRFADLEGQPAMGSAPVAVVVVPFWVSVTGTTTFWLLPLMVSAPATSNLPPPRALMLDDTNWACGNLGTLNHAGLGSSASVSRQEPSVALPVSTVKAILLVANLAGSKRDLCAELLELAFGSTPIWRAVNCTSLCAGTSCCWASAACAPAAQRSANHDAGQGSGQLHAETPFKSQKVEAAAGARMGVGLRAGKGARLAGGGA